ncbi:MAG: FIST signal transduction protein [Planktomarina sp.]
MKIQSFEGRGADAVTSLATAVSAHSGTPDFVALHTSFDIRADIARSAMVNAGVQTLHGGTSCRGIMTQAGHQTNEGQGAGAFCIYDPLGDYGTAMVALHDGPRAAAQSATQAALEAADRAGEIPHLIWLSVTPGCEEDVIRGIQDVVGDGVPVLGGSTADNDISGNWAVFDNADQTDAGVVVSVLFPSTRISIAYQNGYVPTETSGIITKADGRKILEIDKRPAASVYADWTGQQAPAQGSKNILSTSTFAPLGRDAFHLKGVPYYLLAHPSASHADGSLDLFANVSVGEAITLMQGDANELAARAGRVAAQARNTGRIAQADVAGSLIVFCGGCMLGVQDKMDSVVEGVRNALPEKPFLGVFTFGEQGPLHNQGNRHGNLMVSAIVFSSKM